MRSRICNLYLTLRTNDTCEFSPFWANEEYQNTRETEREDQSIRTSEILMGLKRSGVKLLNITGGEPLLRQDLPQVLQQAKGLGFTTKLTTNGILYAEKAKSISGLVDQLYISLDYPTAEQHDRSRGVECFHTVIKAIKLARDLQQRPIINFTVTRDSVLYLPEMVDLAERLRVKIYLNPVSDFYGTQGFALATIAHLRYYFKREHILVNLAVLEFVKNGGNRVYLPRCRAKETTITILPDGKQVEPCFFNQGGAQGREHVCSSCMRWDYMLPSFSLGIDQYFWLNLYTKWRKKT